MSDKFERRQRVISALNALYRLLDQFEDDEYEWSALRKDGDAVVADLEAANEDTAASQIRSVVREAEGVLMRARELRETVDMAIDDLQEVEDDDLRIDAEAAALAIMRQ
ncbi:hypothetical protein ELH62_22495 [Rhizobium ruizarguesonis]|jgi:hypothetical protein|uniref:hypothetical protein n=1 Tax=Rhizobium ruizarguesonis TaxID=2081791 RepID=UPI00102F6BAA|nr:hypothetical protein [Rhizobium ruizarguesonis]TBA44969.1 hypothetical protein ELH62_22495 [Rhizobium ruizarguesonis]